MKRSNKKPQRIESFDLAEGRIIARKYEVISQLGGGWEGEVYKIVERRTGIERAAKLFFPHRNPRNRSSITYAKKLHKLSQCEALIQYHTEEEIRFRNQFITVLISEYVGGTLLLDFLKQLPGKRMSPFQAVHLLYALARGLEPIHQLGEYHGDVHSENIIVNRYGLTFEIKFVDLFRWKDSSYANRLEDLYNIIRVFYDALGGAKHYAKQPEAVKYICCGLRRDLILKRFRSVAQLREHLELMSW